jgi:phage gpG-like protein
MLRLDADIEGDKELSRLLTDIDTGLRSFRPALEKIVPEVLKSIDLNFAARGSLFGGWKPPAKNYGHALLEDSGTMRGAFEFDVFDDHAIIYNPTEYFKYHQSNQPRTKIPRRVMMKLDDERKRFIVKAHQEQIIDLLQGRRPS